MLTSPVLLCVGAKISFLIMKVFSVVSLIWEFVKRGSTVLHVGER